MVLIAGLGNPGREYENTRHNAGFEVVDKLADKYGISVIECKHRALTGRGYVEGERVLLVKPLTYMNRSGESIREIIDYYKVEIESQMIVISDDISLNPGQIRIRKKGSAGGHNGLKDIIAHLGQDAFVRVRIGVGEKPAGWDLADFVLSRFNKEERKLMDSGVQDAADAVGVILTKGADACMNLYNQKKR